MGMFGFFGIAVGGWGPEIYNESKKKLIIHTENGGNLSILTFGWCAVG